MIKTSMLSAVVLAATTDAVTQKSKVDFVSLSFYGLFPVNKIS